MLNRYHWQIELSRLLSARAKWGSTQPHLTTQRVATLQRIDDATFHQVDTSLRPLQPIDCVFAG
jgi:hypothetical protein